MIVSSHAFSFRARTMARMRLPTVRASGLPWLDSVCRSTEDLRLVETVLSDYRDYVPSFYGSLFRDGLGGGRVLDHSHPQTLHDLKAIVAALSSKGIEFNYVVSSTHALNREFDPAYRKGFLDFVSSVRAIGVSIVTLANVTLIELTRSEFPDLRISASVNPRTRTPADVCLPLGTRLSGDDNPL